jgi:hypothetical protein
VPGQQLLGGAEHLHVGGGQHDQVVADPFQVGEQVGGEHHGQALLGDRAHEGLQELAAGQRVQAGQRLVEQQQLPPPGQGQRQGDLGTLPPGQLADLPVERDRESFQPAAGAGLVEAGVELAAEGQVLGGGEVAVHGGVLGHEPHPGEQAGIARSVVQHPDAAGGGREQADGEVQQGGLAGAVGAHQGGDAAPGHGQVAVLEGPVALVALAEPAGFECHAHATPS